MMSPKAFPARKGKSSSSLGSLLEAPRRIQLVSKLFHERNLAQRIPLLPSRNFLRRVSETQEYGRLHVVGYGKVPSHLLGVDPGEYSRANAQVPSGELHVLSGPSGVDHVPAHLRVCHDHDCEAA